MENICNPPFIVIGIGSTDAQRIVQTWVAPIRFSLIAINETW